MAIYTPPAYPTKPPIPQDYSPHKTIIFCSPEAVEIYSGVSFNPTTDSARPSTLLPGPTALTNTRVPARSAINCICPAFAILVAPMVVADPIFSALIGTEIVSSSALAKALVPVMIKKKGRYLFQNNLQDFTNRSWYWKIVVTQLNSKSILVCSYP